MTFVRPDEQARLTYDMIKSGQFEKAILQGMAAQRGGQAPAELPKIINPEKLPDFSVFAKYLTLGGSYSVSDEDGLVATGFTLRKNNRVVRCEQHRGWCLGTSSKTASPGPPWLAVLR